eukprot:CAMPEP_0115844084 /NCGR_PEP_ID=MMETSP0287-20121206/8650_1 /TAXON_ID=412157 /ORGANISM="Chrysochromulina rotalis, Strain UIO044" /LENGTH=358 /DNA_ID=CAMNT_0003297807 /DNA_START=5 /DNA_END=1081 /DNA_ORIENTATION=-
MAQPGMVLRDAFSLGLCAVLCHAFLTGFVTHVVRGPLPDTQQQPQQQAASSAEHQGLVRLEQLVLRLDARLDEIGDQVTKLDRRMRRRLEAAASMSKGSTKDDEMRAAPPSPRWQPTYVPPAAATGSDPPAWLGSLLSDMRNPGEGMSFWPTGNELGKTPAPSADEAPPMGSQPGGAGEASTAATSQRSRSRPHDDGSAASTRSAGNGNDASTAAGHSPYTSDSVRSVAAVAATRNAASSQKLAGAATAVAAQTMDTSARKKPKADADDDWEKQWEKEDEAAKLLPSSSASSPGSSSLLEQLSKLLAEPAPSRAKVKRGRKKKEGKHTVRHSRNEAGAESAATGTGGAAAGFTIEDVD